MVDGEALTSAALASAICSGDSPRATSDLIRPITYSNSASSRSMPILDSRSSASASACALAAEYSQRHGRPQWYLRNLHPLQQRGHSRSLGHAPSGAPAALPPLPGPRDTVRLRATSSATVDGDRPSSLAICLQDLRLSRPLSIAARSALSSLRYGLVAFFLMSFLSLGRAFGPRLKKGFSNSAGHVRLSSRTKAKRSDELAN